jgi:predicted HTH domain antitoxin
MKYPSGFELAIHMTKEEMEHHIRLMAALKMFELGKVSSGKAAEFAGMSRVEFLETCCCRSLYLKNHRYVLV